MICRVCPHRVFNGWGHSCQHPGVTIGGAVFVKIGWVPKWCPLKNKEVNNEKDQPL